ncbi:hypothetical protein AAGQ96_13035 [Pantoea sp. MBD-2R]|uniref:hypothetical protein n=1 Tax=Pantoea sp. MBD-2R TaxID=3141540 RepID=UPI0031845741
MTQLDLQQRLEQTETEREALQQQVNALAAENLALKKFAWDEAVLADNEKQDRWMMECTGARDRFRDLETPATDAIRRQWMADGVDEFASEQKMIADSTDGDYQRFSRAAQCRAEFFAEQLRQPEESGQ